MVWGAVGALIFQPLTSFPPVKKSLWARISIIDGASEVVYPFSNPKFFFGGFKNIKVKERIPISKDMKIDIHGLLPTIPPRCPSEGPSIIWKWLFDFWRIKIPVEFVPKHS